MMPDALLRLSDPTTFAASAALFGLIVGSFLNVVIHRLPIMMEHDWQCQCAELRNEAPPERAPLSLGFPGSRCPSCGHPIGALENIPLLSWLFLRGRCSACQAPISVRYPLVEALSCVLSAAVALHFGPLWAAAGALLLVYALIALTFIDFDTQYLPDGITLPLLWCGLGLNLFGIFADIGAAVIGAMAGYLSLWSVYWGFKLCTGKEGMGYGDFKLLAALGAWFGWQMLPLIVLLSSLVGAIVGVALIVLARRGKDVPIPFGPYLASAGLLALFWGKDLTQMYFLLI